MSDINPKHYQITIAGKPVELVEINMALFGNDAPLSHAFKYLSRAGRKPSSSYLADLGKCVWWVTRAMMQAGAKHIELPPGAPVDKQKTIAAPAPTSVKQKRAYKKKVVAK